MRYIIFVIDGPGNPANVDEMKHIDAFNEKLQNNGNWIMAAGIQQASGATLIDNRNNKNLVEQASLFTGTDSYSPYSIIDWLNSYINHPIDHANQIRKQLGR